MVLVDQLLKINKENKNLNILNINFEIYLAKHLQSWTKDFTQIHKIK